MCGISEMAHWIIDCHYLTILSKGSPQSTRLSEHSSLFMSVSVCSCSLTKRRSDRESITAAHLLVKYQRRLSRNFQPSPRDSAGNDAAGPRYRWAREFSPSDNFFLSIPERTMLEKGFKTSPASTKIS
jgi:hypothetical protein